MDSPDASLSRLVGSWPRLTLAVHLALGIALAVIAAALPGQGWRHGMVTGITLAASGSQIQFFVYIGEARGYAYRRLWLVGALAWGCSLVLGSLVR